MTLIQIIICVLVTFGFWFLWLDSKWEDEHHD